MNKPRLLTLLGGTTLAGKINTWQNSQTDLVYAAGKSDVTPVGVGLEAAAAGITLITALASVPNNLRIRQPGYIWGAKIQIRQVGVGMSVKFKVLRFNVDTYDVIGESEAFSISGDVGLKSFTFTQPIACQVGDLCGVFLTGSVTDGNRVKIEYGTLVNATVRYVAGDITTTNAFTSNIASTVLGIELLCHPPYLCVTGDSIPEGHNTASRFHGFYDATAHGITGTITSEIMNQLRGLISGGTVLQYQNHAFGGQTYAWVLSTGIVSSIATKAKNILIHAGINDIAEPREWALVESDLDAILVLINAASPVPNLLIDEILPWTSGNDTQAGTVRTFNANLATWCTANGATLVKCHDEMGKIRVSTGQLDDLATDYNQDGTHLTQAGVDKMAQIWKRYL